MSSIKSIVYLTCAILVVSVGRAQVAKSQPTSSSISESQKIINNIEKIFSTLESRDGKLGNDKQSRSYTSSGTIDPNNPYLNQGLFQHKQFDLIHLVPIILVLAIIPLVLPIIFQLFAGLFTPFNYPHGRRRRDTNFHKDPEVSQLLLDLAKRVGESIEKFNEFF